MVVDETRGSEALTFRHFTFFEGVKYVCESCKSEALFASSVDAFKAGWSTPEQCGVCTCPTCSAVEVVLGTLSKCCGAPLRVEGKTTQYYVCTKCEKPSDSAK